MCAVRRSSFHSQGQRSQDFLGASHATFAPTATPLVLALPSARAHSAVLFLLPALRTGWLNDDGTSYTYSAYLDFHGYNFWAETTRQVGIFMEGGRFYPVMFYQGYGIFYWVQNEVAYKAMIIMLTACASAAFYFLLRRLRLSAPIAALSIVTATACMQMRDYHDPILSYGGFLQILLIELCASMLLLDTWMKRGRRANLIGATALFVLACATYELTSIFALLYIPITLNNAATIKQRLKALSPFFVTATAFIAITAFLRAISTKVTENYEPGFSPSVLWNTFAKQEFGTLPGSFQVHAKAPDLNSATVFLQNAPASAAALGAFALLLTVAFGIRARVRQNDASPTAPLILALGLIVLPALPLVIAPKYQNELEWGWSYIPVLFQVLGFGLLLALGLQFALSRSKSLAVAAITLLAVSVGISTAYDASLNQLTTADLAKWKTLRHEQQSALRSGLLNDVPDSAVVYVSPPNYWQTKYFFYRYAEGKRFDVRMADAQTPPPTLEGIACTDRANEMTFIFESQRDSNNNNPKVSLKCFPITVPVS